MCRLCDGGKNIPCAANFYNASMIVRPVCHWTVRWLVAVYMQIAIADDDTAIDKSLVRLFADCIAQFMHHDRRVDQIVFLSDHAD